MFRPSPNMRTRRRRGSGGCGTSCGWWPASAPPAAPPLGGPTKHAHDSARTCTTAHARPHTAHARTCKSSRSHFRSSRGICRACRPTHWGESRASWCVTDGTRSAYQTDEFVDGDKQPPGVLQPQVGLGPACVCVCGCKPSSTHSAGPP